MASNDNGNELDAALRLKVDEVKASRTLEVPPYWFMDPLLNLAVAIAENTAHANPFELRVSSELGMVLGIAPGERMRVHTPAGNVTIVSGTEPASTPL